MTPPKVSLALNREEPESEEQRRGATQERFQPLGDRGGVRRVRSLAFEARQLSVIQEELDQIHERRQARAVTSRETNSRSPIFQQEEDVTLYGGIPFSLDRPSREASTWRYIRGSTE